ncbi:MULTISPECIES: HAD family phosphatase [unclassified Streptococcus]|uniref:HAD family hydrolase n=1 Tax=unclassified Streptococcus TaxID=2608887 RepID=UPI001071AF91|nr:MULTISPECIES: HAD family phosphatase [unclassified Streptococcus]MBF0788132.1 HAD family phosphatase [Streptococcus sp. 19428wC2_LYSM12]MCQ9211266.1 HAD family phosphatase [Streptococcus sp. B01]MCQ9214579.1 HAD family phosphatase [Streptococcus sp. O1]TFV04805.1 HAD family phosphatase [Streptococcus sp. LYSM12]
MTYKGIIFDMDGVLFQTEDFYYKRRADFLATKGLSVAHLDPAIFVGGRVNQVWKLVLRDDYDHWDIPALEAEYRQYKEERPTPYKACVFSDVSEVLSTLKERGIELALASNTDRSEIERALTEAGIFSYFSYIFSGTECRSCKPDPEIYEKACAELGFVKSEILVIEDSPKGIEAGKAAGLTVWAIRDQKFGLDQSQADDFLDQLGDLLDKV